MMQQMEESNASERRNRDFENYTIIVEAHIRDKPLTHGTVEYTGSLLSFWFVPRDL